MIKKMSASLGVLLIMGGCGVQPPPQIGTPPEPPAPKIDPNLKDKIQGPASMKKEYVRPSSKVPLDKEIAKDIHSM